MVHNESGTTINSYHYPGFGAGHDYQETQLLDMLRHEAFAIRGLPVPPITPPTQPPVLFHTKGGLTWRGSTGAGYYEIERALSATGPWQVRATGLHDSVIGLAKELEANPDPSPVTLWSDEYAAAGTTYYYRIRGFNVAGATEYSAALAVVQP